MLNMGIYGFEKFQNMIFDTNRRAFHMGKTTIAQPIFWDHNPTVFILGESLKNIRDSDLDTARLNLVLSKLFRMLPKNLC